MSSVRLPDGLVDQIAAAGVAAGSVDEFVQQAVQEKLDWEARRREFFRIADGVRQAMLERGLTEQEILDDFDAFRRRMNGLSSE